VTKMNLLSSPNQPEFVGLSGYGLELVEMITI